MERLNDLQRQVEVRVRELIQESGRSVEERNVLEAEVPFYSDEPFWLLKLRSQDLELWIYDDELSFASEAGGGGLELVDFEGEEEFLQALSEKIQAVL